MGFVKAASSGSSLKNMLVPKKKVVIFRGIGNGSILKEHHCTEHSVTVLKTVIKFTLQPF